MLIDKFYRWLAFRGKQDVNEIFTIGTTVHGFYRRGDTTIHIAGLQAAIIRRYFSEIDSFISRKEEYESK